MLGLFDRNFAYVTARAHKCYCNPIACQDITASILSSKIRGYDNYTSYAAKLDNDFIYFFCLPKMRANNEFVSGNWSDAYEIPLSSTGTGCGDLDDASIAPVNSISGNKQGALS